MERSNVPELYGTMIRFAMVRRLGEEDVYETQ